SFVAEQLRVTCERIAEARDALGSREHEARWLERCEQREQCVDVCDEVSPASWLRSRLGLSESQERAIRVLVAHELDRAARTHLRDLASENEPDVTLDVLRGVVYGTHPSARAWRELAPTGALRAMHLIEPVDAATDVPTHRTTFRVSRRVLALVHGVVEVDEELRKIAQLDEHELKLDTLMVPTEARDEVCARIAGGDSRLVILHGARGSG